MPTTDTITVRMPGAFARAWEHHRGDDHVTFEPAAVAIARAVAAADVYQTKGAVKGTSHEFTLPRVLARHFAALVQQIVDTELHAEGVSDQDKAAGRAGAKLLQRLADRGITAEWADGYKLPDPADQAALELRAQCAREEAAVAEQRRQQVEASRADRKKVEVALAGRAGKILVLAGLHPVTAVNFDQVTAAGWKMRASYGAVSITAELEPPTEAEQEELKNAPDAEAWRTAANIIDRRSQKRRQELLRAYATALRAEGFTVEMIDLDNRRARLRATPATKEN